MKEYDVQEIDQHFKRPIIGVIGATLPDWTYNEQMGIQVGYQLTDHLIKNGGALFTGGVGGVGVDTFRGFVDYCLDTSLHKNGELNNPFFLLVPKFDFPPDFPQQTEESFPYLPPEEYNNYARLLPVTELQLVRAGYDMGERRRYVAQVADKLVMVNGGLGTLDEAFNMLNAHKDVICLQGSGGTADFFAKLSGIILDPGIRAELMHHRIQIGDVDTNQIKVVSRIEEIIEHLN
jgi:predicted Rossmann-fold nucleotide-binding protein